MYKVSIYKMVIKWVQNRHYLALVCGEIAGMVGGLPPIYTICSMLFVVTKKSTNALTRFTFKPIIEIIGLSNGVVAQMRRQLVKLK